MTDSYFDGLGQPRAVMSWAEATRLQLSRWEHLVALDLWLSSYQKATTPGHLIWQAEFEHHFTLIAARNLIRALDLGPTTVSVDATVRRELIAGRDLHEHWVDNMPIFNVTPRPAEPTHRSAKGFAERNPRRSPYDWLAWSSNEGALLLAVIPASAVYDLVEQAEDWAISQHSDLAEYRLPPAGSPWMERTEQETGWWPKQAEDRR